VTRTNAKLRMQNAELGVCDEEVNERGRDNQLYREYAF
jgi:hypothetical protein